MTFQLVGSIFKQRVYKVTLFCPSFKRIKKFIHNLKKFHPPGSTILANFNLFLSVKWWDKLSKILMIYVSDHLEKS